MKRSPRHSTSRAVIVYAAAPAYCATSPKLAIGSSVGGGDARDGGDDAEVKHRRTRSLARSRVENQQMPDGEIEKHSDFSDTEKFFSIICAFRKVRLPVLERPSCPRTAVVIPVLTHPAQGIIGPSTALIEVLVNFNQTPYISVPCFHADASSSARPAARYNRSSVALLTSFRHAGCPTAPPSAACRPTTISSNAAQRSPLSHLETPQHHFADSSQHTFLHRT